jgi:uroporphyrinogen decarboxylase
MRRINEFLIPAAEIMIKAGVDGVFIADDLGFKSNCFFQPEYMREKILPEIERLARHIKSLGSYALLHSCGCVNPIISDLMNMGLDAIHPLQQTAGMDLADVKQKYGDRICIIGNVDSTNVLPNGTVEDVRTATLECMKTGAKGGRFVLASDSDLRDDMPLENMLCMIETALENNEFQQYQV